jgi:hypothetical protein
VLHVTNGDCAIAVLRAAGMHGDLLPWRDVLHEGPVDPRLPLADLSAVRARFIADSGWASLEEAGRQFRERDERLQRCAADEEVVLWFEHDLYDQLQLVQLLAWFRAHPHPRLTLVCEAEYLGEMAPSRAAALFASRRAVAPEQLQLGWEAWNAFPGGIESFLMKDLSRLPFLEAALKRYLEEPRRTEALIAGALAGGPLEFGELFRRTQEKDEPRFLGDTVFLQRVERMERLGRLRKEGSRWRLL